MGKDSSYAINLGVRIKKLYTWGTHVPPLVVRRLTYYIVGTRLSAAFETKIWYAFLVLRIKEISLY